MHKPISPLLNTSSKKTSSLMNTAKDNLGWSVDSDNRKKSKLFDLRDEDVALQDTYSNIEIERFKNINEINKSIKYRFNIDLTFGKLFGVANIGGNANLGKDNNENKNDDVVFTSILITYVTPCMLTKCELKKRENLSNNDIQNKYINSGKIIKGYILIINRNLSDYNKVNINNQSVRLTAINNYLKTEFDRISKNRKSEKNDEIKILFTGIGGFESPLCFKPNESSFEKNIDDISSNLHNQLESLAGHFLWDAQKDTVKFEINYREQQEVSTLLGRIEKIYSIINGNAINLDALKIEYLKIGLDKCKDQAKAIKEKLEKEIIDYKNSAIDIQTIEKSLQKLFDDDIRNNLIISECPVSFSFNMGNRNYYLVYDDNYFSYKEHMSDCQFILVESNLSKGHFKNFLIKLNDRYLKIFQKNPQDVPSLCFTDKDNATHWHLEPTDSKKITYHLVATDSTNIVIKKPDTDINPVVKLCKKDDSHKASFFITHDSFNLKLSRLINANNSINITVKKQQDIIHKQNATKELSKEEEMQISIFLNDIIPVISKVKNESLIYFVGNTGAGKSSFINYLLGHKFKIDVVDPDVMTVIDEKIPNAEMGPTGSVTRVSQVYTGEYKYLDNPGFNDTGGKLFDNINAFSMFLTKEMAKEIQAIVVIIEVGELVAGRGAYFSKLIKELQALMHFNTLRHIEDNVIFIINLKSSRHYTIEQVRRKIDNCMQNCSKELEPFTNYINTISNDDNVDNTEVVNVSQENQSLIAKTLEALAENGQKLKHTVSSLRRLTDAVERLGDDKKNRLAEYAHTLKILEMIKQNNIFVWKEPNNEECKIKFLNYFKNIHNKKIHKDYLRFGYGEERIQNILSLFQIYISNNYYTPLITLDYEYDNLLTRVNTLKNQLIHDREKQNDEFKRQKRILMKSHQMLQKQLIKLDEEIFFQYVELIGKESSLFKFVWWPTSETKPYIGNNKQLYTKLIIKHEEELKKNNIKIVDNIRQDSQDGVKFSNYYGKFESTKFLENIEPGIIVGELRGLAKDRLDNIGLYDLKLSEIESKNKQIKEVCLTIDQLNSLTEDQYCEKNKELKNLNDDLDRIKFKLATYNSKPSNINQFKKLSLIDEILNGTELSNDQISILKEYINLYKKITGIINNKTPEEVISTINEQVSSPLASSRDNQHTIFYHSNTQTTNEEAPVKSVNGSIKELILKP